MRVLLFGRNGQLGRELQTGLAARSELTALDVDDLDLGDERRLDRCILEAKPDVIVNAAAYTAVDQAEGQADLARRVNAVAPGIMADAARRLQALFIHYSTDYVFDGTKGAPYLESDPPNPLNAYGRTKLEGERAVTAAGGTELIFRTSWVYSLAPASFVGRVLAWSRQQESLRFVTDQVSSPTWARLLALLTLRVLELGGSAPGESLQPLRGIYHLAGKGFTSRLGWARKVLEFDPHPEEQTCRRIEPALTADFPSPARRPAFSALDCSRFEDSFGIPIPDWEVSLRQALQAGNAEDRPDLTRMDS